MNADNQLQMLFKGTAAYLEVLTGNSLGGGHCKTTKIYSTANGKAKNRTKSLQKWNEHHQ